MFNGCITALATPFNKSGNICKRQLKKLLSFQINAFAKERDSKNAHGFVVAGCTGENFTLTETERATLLAAVIENVEGKFPIIMGTGAPDTKTAVARAIEAKKLGANAVLAITPYGNKPSQKALLSYFLHIADVDIPVILYNVPSRTGCNLLPETVIKLTEHPSIVGIKEASGNIDQASAILSAKPDFCVLSGDDSLTLPMMAIGARGVISTVSNVVPRHFAQMTRNFSAGNIAEAQKIHLQVFPLIKALFLEGNPVPLKAALDMLGIIENNLRQPLAPASDETCAALEKALNKLALKIKKGTNDE